MGRTLHAVLKLVLPKGSLERAIKKFCGEDLRVGAAGRTAAGVHATGQVVHVNGGMYLGG